MSQIGSLSAGGGGATLLHELMGFLRRGLGQQPEVRRALYCGLPVLLAADPTAQEVVVEPLLPHFCRYYELDEQLSPPLKLEECAKLQARGGGVAARRGTAACRQRGLKPTACARARLPRCQGDNVRVVEPLQHLLGCLRSMLAVAPANNDGSGARPGALPAAVVVWPVGLDAAAALCTRAGPADDGGEATRALRMRFASLRKRMVDSTLESFNFDRSTDLM